MKIILASISLSLLLVTTGFTQIRKTQVKEDDILTVKTALGIATILQLPETIQSAIIGDQSGFKIEYLEKAVTIKPLRFGAKTNLYLVTGSRRFNVRLVSGSQEQADYVVYLKKPELPKPETKWHKVARSAAQRSLKLSVVRIGFTPNGFILVDALLTTSQSKSMAIKPESVWVKQVGGSRVMNSLFMSDARVEKSKPLRLGISLAKSDLISGKPITIELSAEESVSLQLTEADLWK